MNEREKKEFLEDGMNVSLRDDFQKIKEHRLRADNFDTYISFLMQIQKIFGPFKVSKKPIIINDNKLL